MVRYVIRNLRFRSRRALTLCIVLLVVSVGCVGGIPRVPNSPEKILAEADKHYQKRNFFQAQHLYRSFLERHPGHERSDYAQFMLGETHFAEKEWALSTVEYHILVTNYGYSDLVDDGFFKGAIALFKQCPENVRLDQSKCDESLSKLMQFIQVFPQSTRIPEAEEYVAKINARQAQKHLKNALLYVSQKKYKSAIIYLDKIIENYPDNDYWIRAKYWNGRVREMRGEYTQSLRWYLEVEAHPRRIDVTSKASEGAKRVRRQIEKEGS